MVKKRVKCPNLETNKANCPCTATNCANHGICCACVENHRKSGDLPACLR